MGHQTLEQDYRPPLRRDVVNVDFRNLLVEAYQEREALLRGAITIAPESYQKTHDTTDPGDDRAWNHADSSRRDFEGSLSVPEPRDDRVESWPQETPHFRDPSIPRLRVAAGEVRDRELGRQEMMTPTPEIGDIARSVARTASKLPAVVAHNVVEAFLPSQQRETNHDVALQRLWRRGLVLIAIFGGAVGFWSVATTMSGAVIASGQFVVDGSVKKVQHPTGGVVGELLVREGDQVAEGDLLVRLDETVTRANLQVIVGQIDELTGRRARLEAERDGNDAIAMPPELTTRLTNPEVARVVSAEQKLFQVRRAARESHRAQLTKRINQHRNEIAGLRSQLEANGRESEIIAEELKGVRDLFAKSLTPIMRLNGLERQAVNLTGQKGQFTASIAQIEGKVAEVELQIIQIDDDLRAETQKELREVQGRIAELSERRVAAEDQLKRVELRAPSPGTVHQLAVHTVGGVIVAAEPVMLIVPSREELILETKVMPQDRDQLHVGQKATVRVRSSNRRTTPELNGSLARIAADVTKETTAAVPLYTVWVSIPKSELARLHGLSINAGMQADVFIEIGSRSPLSYLLRPLTDQVARAFKER